MNSNCELLSTQNCEVMRKFTFSTMFEHCFIKRQFRFENVAKIYFFLFFMNENNSILATKCPDALPPTFNIPITSDTLVNFINRAEIQRNYTKNCSGLGFDSKWFAISDCECQREISRFAFWTFVNIVNYLKRIEPSERSSVSKKYSGHPNVGTTLILQRNSTFHSESIKVYKSAFVTKSHHVKWLKLNVQHKCLSIWRGEKQKNHLKSQHRNAIE